MPNSDRMHRAAPMGQTAAVEARTYGAVVLAGGDGVRLGGGGKASVEIGGETLLEHALGALIDVRDIVVVGDPVPTTRPVTFVREDPVGGGPAAGLLAGLDAFPFPPTWLITLAVDMPLVTSWTIRRLTRAATRDGAVLIDENQRQQPLCAVYRSQALNRVRPEYGGEHGMSLRDLLAPLLLDQVPSMGGESKDVDSYADLREVRELLGED